MKCIFKITCIGFFLVCSEEVIVVKEDKPWDSDMEDFDVPELVSESNPPVRPMLQSFSIIL